MRKNREIMVVCQDQMEGLELRRELRLNICRYLSFDKIGPAVFRVGIGVKALA